MIPLFFPDRECCSTSSHVANGVRVKWWAPYTCCTRWGFKPYQPHPLYPRLVEENDFPRQKKKNPFTCEMKLKKKIQKGHLVSYLNSSTSIHKIERVCENETSFCSHHGRFSIAVTPHLFIYLWHKIPLVLWFRFGGPQDSTGEDPRHLVAEDANGLDGRSTTQTAQISPTLRRHGQPDNQCPKSRTGRSTSDAMGAPRCPVGSYMEMSSRGGDTTVSCCVVRFGQVAPALDRPHATWQRGTCNRHAWRHTKKRLLVT